jgi:wyosine [tRNA(Phe)-imidazoG37] synthetase (radical SAM superfamily)
LDSSLGINNIALKHCTYNCVYCQVGKGIFLKPDRRAFYNPKEFFESVRRRLESIESNSSLLRDKKVRDELSEADFF